MIKGINISYRQLTNEQINLIKQSNTQYIRLDAVESNLDYYNKLKPNINILSILDYATMGNNPFTLDEWKNKVKEVVSKYSFIKVWEIWNEPTAKNFQLGYQDGTPEHYFEMLKSAYQIIKSIDSSMIVVGFGGVYANDKNFIENVIKLGGLNYCDAVSIHIYPNGKHYPCYLWYYYWDLNYIKKVFNNKQIWITETGVMSNYNNQVRYINSVIPMFRNIGVYAVFWYDITDYFDSNGFRGWGLFTEDWKQKQSYYAWSSMK